MQKKKTLKGNTRKKALGNNHLVGFCRRVFLYVEVGKPQPRTQEQKYNCMLENATPRARLHLQRILSRFDERGSGDRLSVSSTTFRGSPPKKIMLKGSGNSLTLSSGASVLKFDAPEQLVRLGSSQHAGGNGRIRAANNGNALSTEQKDSEWQRHSGRLGKSGQVNKNEKRPTFGGSFTGKSALPSAVLSLSRLLEPEVPVSCFRYCGNCKAVMDAYLISLEHEETRYRQLVEEMALSNIEELLHARSYGVECAKQLGELVDLVADVCRFVCTPADEVVQDPDGHIARLIDAKTRDGPMNVKDALLTLRGIPAIIANNYKCLLSVCGEVADAEEESLSEISTPQPQSSPRPEPYNVTISNGTLVSLWQNSIFSNCGSVHASGACFCQPSNGVMSLNTTLLLNESPKGDEHSPFNLTPIDKLAMYQKEPRVDKDITLENLQEESAYWQEEALNAMSEVEMWLHMAHTLLGAPTSTSFDNTEQQQTSVTKSSLVTQRPNAQHLFVQLLEEKEKVERALIIAQEAQGWWQLLFTAKV